ncbi:MAG: hypothetical protein EOO90_04105 [Pedobacter sp.]|nr:MAG: hypothetical protein EOO90_04105 [Pedobacter sp.]
MSKFIIHNPIYILLLLLFPLTISAQVRNDTYLADLFNAQGGAQLFNQVENIRLEKKNKIRSELGNLSDVERKTIIERSMMAMERPWTNLTFSEFNEFKLNGNRSNYEANYFGRRNKLTALLIGELVEGKGRFLPEIVNGIGMVVEESTWALPAHMYLQKAGDGLPDAEEPVIDLFVSQTATLLSWTRFLLTDELNAYSPLLIRRIDAELEKRVFTPYVERDDFFWMGFNKRKMNNWNIYCNTNVLISALIAQDDQSIRNKIIEKSTRSVDRFLSSYSPDGGCDEGPAYWGIAGGALVDYLGQLSDFSDSRLNFSGNKLVHQIATYIYKVHIDKTYYVNFADAGATANQDIGKIYRYGKLFDDKELLQFAAYIRSGRAAVNVDMASIHAFVSGLGLDKELSKFTPKAPQPKQAWFPDLQVATARQQAGSSRGLFLAVKGGHNAESHNHNDVGNFVIYKDGTPVVVDAGVGVYTKQTFSADRYKLWYMQSGWHNCPTINGVMQQQGGGFAARNVNYSQTEDNVTVNMDIAQAYPKSAEVNKWERSFVFNSKRGQITLSESYDLKRFISASTLSFLVNGDVKEVAKGKLAITNYQGNQVYLSFPHEQFKFRVETQEIADSNLKKHWSKPLVRITLEKLGSSLVGSHQIQFN